MCMRLQSTLLDVHKCQKWSYLPCLAFLAFRMESHFHCGLGTKDFVVPWCWMLLNFCRTETSCKCVLPQLPWFYEFFDISARTRISPSLRKAKRCPDVYRWFWPWLKGRAIESGAMVASTLLDVQKCEKWSYLPHRAFLESHLEPHHFHCGLTLQESKRWPRAGEIGGVEKHEKLRLCSFRWGTSVSQACFCLIPLGLPEDTWEGLRYSTMALFVVLNGIQLCAPFGGRVPFSWIVWKDF